MPAFPDYAVSLFRSARPRLGSLLLRSFSKSFHLVLCLRMDACAPADTTFLQCQSKLGALPRAVAGSPV